MKRLSFTEAKKVKELIIDGFAQRKIARIMKISQPHVSNIHWGLAHEDVPWPNGLTGGFDEAYPKRDSSLPTAFEANQAQLGLPTRQLERVQEVGAKDYIQRQVRGLSDDVKKGIEKIHLQVEEEKEAEARRNLESSHRERSSEEIEEEGTSDRGINPWEAKFLSIEEVKEADPENLFVEMLEAEPDETLARAVGIVYYSLQQELWSTTSAVKAIDDMRKLLKISD